MNITDEETGDMFIRQGDNFSLRVKNVSPEYSVFFAVSDTAGNIIFELSATREGNDAIIKISPEYSNKLVVPHGKKQEVYYYGIKLCKQDGTEQIEDTLVIGNKNIGEPNKITVYSLLVEGTLNHG